MSEWNGTYLGGSQTAIPVIPAKAGLRRQDAEANIRAADGPKRSLRTQALIQFDVLSACSAKIKMDPGFRRDDGSGRFRSIKAIGDAVTSLLLRKSL